MLVGVPKEDQADLLAVFQQTLHDDNGDRERSLMDGILAAAAWFNDYLDWREQNPSDDVMTQLLRFEFEDESGATRTLRRDEILTYLNLISTAGSDTTATGISWAGSLLNDHPDQRQELVDDPTLIPQALEEVLRCEPPSYHFCRWTTKDTEFHGTTIPAESIVVVLPPRGEPRRSEVGRLRALRHPPRTGTDLHLRLRAALLPGRQPGAAGSPHRAGGDPAEDQQLDRRLRRRHPVPRLRHPRLAATPRHDRLSRFTDEARGREHMVTPVASEDVVFPMLDPSQIAFLEGIGERRTIAPDDYLYRAGDESYDFFGDALGCGRHRARRRRRRTCPRSSMVQAASSAS